MSNYYLDMLYIELLYMFSFFVHSFTSYLCKEQVRISLEKRLQQSVSQLEGEKNEEINQLQQRIEELQQHIENLCKQHEEALLRAENDKQQALLIGMYN